MNKLILPAFLITLTLTLTACASQVKPMTEADMAAKYNLTAEAYESAKADAAAMNMTVEQHLDSGHNMMDM